MTTHVEDSHNGFKSSLELLKTFHTVEDLSTIDALITDLDKKKESLATQVKEINEQGLQSCESAFNTIKQELNDAATSHVTSSADHLQKLEEEYGKLGVLETLRSGVERTQLLSDSIENLQWFTQIVSSIDSLSQTLDEENRLPSSALLPIRDKLGDRQQSVGTHGRQEGFKGYLTGLAREKFTKLVETLASKQKHLLSQALENVDWPAKPPSSKWGNEIFDPFNELLHLQALIDPHPTYPNSLWAYDGICQVFHLRFVYHFDSNQESNRPDKPEWAMEFLENFLSTNGLRFSQLWTECKSSYDDSALSPVYRDSVPLFNFITALLVPLRRKVINLATLVSSNPAYLSHLIVELQSFDERIRSRYKYNPFFVTSGEADIPMWNGLTGDIMESGNLFDVWLDVEKRFALTRYSEITDDPDAWEIDFESFPESEIKGTKSAEALVNLLDIIIGHYAPLKNLKYQLRFLSQIHFHLLEKYLARLTEALKAFEALSTSSISKSLVGVNMDESLSGERGLKSLCKTYCSCNYMIQSMQEWGEDLLFLELYKQLNDFMERKKAQGLPANQGLDIDKDDIKREGKPIKSSIVLNHTLFDDLVVKYESLNQDLFAVLGTVIKRELKKTLNRYFALDIWGTSVNTDEEITQSSELSYPVSLLSEQLDLTRKCFSPSHHLQLERMIDVELSDQIFNHVVLVNRFSAAGSRQLKFDVDQVWKELRLPKSRGFSRLAEAARVLSLNDDILKKEYHLESTIDSLQKVPIASSFSYEKRDFQSASPWKKEMDEFQAAVAIVHLSYREILDLLSRIVVV